jgi:circadian clock protein KaiC
MKKNKKSKTKLTRVGGYVPKVTSGIEGLDSLLYGGLPRGRTTLLVGSSGSGKTILSCELAWRSIHDLKEPCVFVTFEESKERIVKNVKSFGWDLKKLEQEGKLIFLELAPGIMMSDLVAGDFDLTVVIERIKFAIKKIKAKKVVIDSLSALFTHLGLIPQIRKLMLDLAESLNQLGVTTLITAERLEEYGPLTRFNVEEFVSDCVIVLRNILEDEKIRRTLQVLKFRGSRQQQGEFPFTITDQGIVVMPLVGMELTQKSSLTRISSGNKDLDKMCGGGFFRDSIILVSGPTGTGKTLLVSTFIDGACQNGEKALLFAFEESKEQLYRNGTSWGVNLAKWEKKGLLKVVCRYPESMGAEDHLLSIKKDIEAFKPKRIAVDSLSAMERVVTTKAFREFVISITSYIKSRETAGMFTNTSETLMGGESITETHISTLTDSIVILRYVEIGGEMRRALTAIKMRGSWHDKEIREYEITGNGMIIKGAFRNVEGILTGQPRSTIAAEKEELGKLV